MEFYTIDLPTVFCFPILHNEYKLLCPFDVEILFWMQLKFENGNMFFFRLFGVRLQDYVVLTSGRLGYGEDACFV